MFYPKLKGLSRNARIPPILRNKFATQLDVKKIPDFRLINTYYIRLFKNKINKIVTRKSIRCYPYFMKHFKQIVSEQKSDIIELKLILEKEITNKIIPNKLFIGALLTGSVARGDARIKPFGIYIDLALVVRNKNEIDLEKIFGKNAEPFIPYFCIKKTDKIGIAIELIEENELWNIRDQNETTIFAKNESIILYDETKILKKWKDECFIITTDQVKTRALENYFRFTYLTDEYRFEKWNYRQAYIQIAQNLNEAAECYLNFLYCINKYFIPRKDWLVYLSYDLKIKPEEHTEYMDHLYTSSLTPHSIEQKNKIIEEISKWMKNYCQINTWLKN